MIRKGTAFTGCGKNGDSDGEYYIVAYYMTRSGQATMEKVGTVAAGATSTFTFTLEAEPVATEVQTTCRPAPTWPWVTPSRLPPLWPSALMPRI